MNRLSELIGPAPGELSRSSLIAKIELERDRTQRGLVTLRSKKSQKEKKAPLESTLALLGISPEQYQKLLGLAEAKK